MTDDSKTNREILRGASDGLLIAIREVDAKERQKRGVRPGDPGFAPVAREVRLAAEAVLKLAREEEDRAEVTSGNLAGAGLPTINASTPRADLAELLGAWRAIERELEAAEPGSAEAGRLMDDFEAVRDRYARALDAIKRKS